MAKRTTVKDLESQIAGLRNRLDDQAVLIHNLITANNIHTVEVTLLRSRVNAQLNLLEIASSKLRDLSVSLLATNHVLERNGLTNPVDWVRTYQRAVSVHDQVSAQLRDEYEQHKD